MRHQYRLQYGCCCCCCRLLVRNCISLLILHEQNEYKLNTLRIFNMWQERILPVTWLHWIEIFQNIELTAKQFAQLLYSLKPDINITNLDNPNVLAANLIRSFYGSHSLTSHFHSLLNAFLFTHQKYHLVDVLCCCCCCCRCYRQDNSLWRGHTFLKMHKAQVQMDCSRMVETDSMKIAVCNNNRG